MFHYNSPTPGWSTHNFLIIYTKVFRAWSFSKGKFHRWVLAEILLLVQGTGIFISHLNFIMELKKKKGQSLVLGMNKNCHYYQAQLSFSKAT